MVTMHVSLPDGLRDWVDARTRSERYSNASEYIRDLIQRDQERAGHIAEIQRQIREGLESGISDQSMDDVLAEARSHARPLTPSDV